MALSLGDEGDGRWPVVSRIVPMGFLIEPSIDLAVGWLFVFVAWSYLFKKYGILRGTFNRSVFALVLSGFS